jgi:metal-responsive CopG/Arc/MetJ family transcriptional regulator
MASVVMSVSLPPELYTEMEPVWKENRSEWVVQAIRDRKEHLTKKEDTDASMEVRSR